MAFARGFDSAWQIRERCVIDFEGDRLKAMSWIAERHLSGVTEKAEASHVGNGVDWFCGLLLLVDFLKSRSGGGVQGAHSGDGGSERFRSGAIFFKRSGDNTGAKRLGEEQHVAGLGANVAPDALGIDGSRNCIAEEHVFVAYRVAANYAALCLVHFGEATANNLLENFRVAFFGKANNG